MKNYDLIKNTNLDNTFIIGYYGGGNFGDELLLEVLQNLLKKEDTKDVKFYYTGEWYNTFHGDYGYEAVAPENKGHFIKKLFSSDNIIIGGGGIWGLDFNFKILVLSVLLFFMRFVFQKNVYLMGIGYYSSTTRLGHIAAWITAKACKQIITRDDESYANFSRYSKNVSQDYDLSFNIPHTLDRNYDNEVKKLEEIIEPKKETIIMSTRHFKKKFKNDYRQIMEDIIKNNPKKKFVLNTFEPKDVDLAGWEFINELYNKYDNVHNVFDFSFNPLSYYYFQKKHAKKLITIAPQFHSIITSYQAGVRFFPFVYDNKVEEVLKQMGIKKYKWIFDLETKDIQEYLDSLK